MINDIIKTRSGLISTENFKIKQLKRLSRDIEQCMHQDVSNVFTGAVNTLDVDKKANRYLLSACSDGSIFVHDLFNFRGVPQFTARCISSANKYDEGAHRCSIECATWFENDYESFLTSGLDQIVKMWDFETMKPVDHFLFKGRIFCHDCTPIKGVNPILAVATSFKDVELLDVRYGTGVIDLKGHNSSVLACKWSPLDEYLLATGGLDGRILYWDVRQTDHYLVSLDKLNKDEDDATAHSGIVNGLQFTSNGLLLLSTGTDNEVRLWDTHRGQNLSIKYGKLENDVKRHLGFSICNTSSPLAFVPSEGYIYILELYTGKTRRILNGHFNIVNCTYFREINLELYTAGRDQTVLTWNADTRLPQDMRDDEDEDFEIEESSERSTETSGSYVTE